MKQAFWPLVVFTSILDCIAIPVIGYFDNKYDFSLLSIVIFDICHLFMIVQFYCIVSAGFVAWSVPFFYLKYKFKEIHQTIQMCVKQNNINVLKRVIAQHNRLVVQTKLIDDVFRFIVFILYYVGSPALLLLLYLSHSDDTSPYVRPIFIFILSIVYFVVFYLNFICAQITHSAVKPRVSMHKLLIEGKLRISDRIKIMEFVEKVSGPDIGFHCWNLFPMNNYTFSEYVGSCARTYFLILGLIENI